MIWLYIFCESDFDIKHVKGKENQVIDALSTKIHVMHATVVRTCKSYLKIRILEVLISSGYYLQLKEKSQKGDAQQKYKDTRLE